MKCKIAGILNITSDSFSDGGFYLSKESAITKANELICQGANLLDIGAQSSHPDSEDISIEEEIHRLIPVIQNLKQQNYFISIDTYQPEVMKRVLEEGVDMINDITALHNKYSQEIIKSYGVPVVIMFSRNNQGRAQKIEYDKEVSIHDILHFFDKKINKLIRFGIPEKNIIIDPGMGFFLSSNPGVSLSILKQISILKELHKPIYISTSRKSFIGNVLNRSVAERDFGTLASEIWCYLEGVDFIRTHNVKGLCDGLTMIHAIRESD